jgi:SPP1 family predicted phage head-tail adaptor
MLPAGILRERIVIEEAREVRNPLGESVQTWYPVARRAASVEAIAFSESTRRQQTGGDTSYTVRMRYYPALTAAMRVRWESRNDRILWIAGLLERGRREEHELTCEERG